MKISLIVTTNNRPIIFERLLKSIADSNYNNIELIVVDQNPTDINKKLIDRYSENIMIKYVNVGETISLSKARNMGIPLVQGDIIGFPDDDCWYPSDFFVDLCNIFNTNCLDGICTGVFDPIKNVVYGNKQSKNNIDKINFKNVIRFTTSVGIFVKTDIGINKFDERLGVGAEWRGGEDIDYVCNLISENKNIYFINGLQVYHEVEKERPLDKEYLYSVGGGAVIAKIYRYYKYKNIYKFYCIRQIKSLIGMILFRFIDNNKYNRYRNKFKGLKYGFTNWK